MTGRRIGAIGCAFLFGFAALIAVPRPAAAECSLGFVSWPSFREVAPAARAIVVGTVLENRDPYMRRPWEPAYRVVRGKMIDAPSHTKLGGFLTTFAFRIDEVVRGERNAGDLIVISELQPGLPRARCGFVHLGAIEGDVVAIALDGRDARGRTGVNAAAWITGGLPDGLDYEALEPEFPNAERITVMEVRRLAGRVPASTIATARGPVRPR